jgi:hypothetical protein
MKQLPIKFKIRPAESELGLDFPVSSKILVDDIACRILRPGRYGYCLPDPIMCEYYAEKPTHRAFDQLVGWVR